MKKGCFKLILTVLALTTLDAEPITFEKLYGTKEDDSAKSVITTEQGFLIIGYTEGDRDKREDIYLLHIDKSGNKLWSKSIGGEDRELGEKLLAADDGYLAIGMTESFNGHRSKIYLIKLNKEGQLVWQETYRSNSDSYYYGTGIAPTSKGYKVAGWENKLGFMNSEAYTYSFDIDKEGQRTSPPRRHGTEDDEKIYDMIQTDDGYLLIGETNHIDDDAINAYALKIDNEGKKVWHQSYGWRYNDWAEAGVATEKGYLLVGTTESNRDKRSEIYVLEIDKNGKTLWQHTYGGEYNEEGFDVIAESDGYVIAGLTESNAKGRSDAYLIKIDKQGKLLWEKQYGGENSDIAYGVAKSDDGYIIVGETESYNSERKDVYVIKTDKQGNIL